MTINYLIVEIDEAYNNIKDGIVVNSTIESVKHINRVATVVDSPNFTTVKKGDKVVCHHNMFRLRNGIGGKLVKSNYHLEDNRYFIPLNEVFAFKREEEWEALAPFVFVKPIPKKDSKVGAIIINSDKDNSHKGMEKLKGILKYPNKELREEGFKEGDKVIFSDWSEYEFEIEGELLYKMSSRDILAKISE